MKGGRLLSLKVPVLRRPSSVPKARCILADCGNEATHAVIPGNRVCRLLPLTALKVCEDCVPRLERR